MKTTTLIIATAFALGALAGCNRNDATPKQPSSSAPPSSQAGTGSSAAQSNTPSTPANVGKDAKHEGSQPPVQGREDVRQPEQQKDFQHKGDGAGPKQ